MNPFFRITLLWALCVGGGLLAQGQGGMDFKAREGFLDIVGPIITAGERDIYQKTPDQDGRRYFEALFWHKRNPDPTSVANPFRKAYYERRQIVAAQFSSEDIPGTESDRGRIYLLLGAPDSFSDRTLPVASLRPAREETWTYAKAGTYTNLVFTFVYDGVRPDYRLQEAERWEPTLESIRNSQVLDRAEPYTMAQLPLTLPYIGFTKDIENLASEDKHDLDFTLDYSFYKGDANRTEVRVTLTFHDASPRGMDVNLSAYDPYGEKAREFKKLIEPKNGECNLFSITIEPDQYTMVLRLQDKDGREAISRVQLDVPTMNAYEPYASSLLLAGSLEKVPLFGFIHPKDLIYGDTYFPPQNSYRDFKGERLYANQIFYNLSELPELTWYIDHQKVDATQALTAQEEGSIRVVASLPAAGLEPGRHHVKSTYRDLAGNLVVSGTYLTIGTKNDLVLDLIAAAATTPDLSFSQPSDNSITSLERVTLKAAPTLDIQRLFVFLNNTLILEQDKAPWSVSLDPGLFSVSGKHTVTAVAQTGRGLVKVAKSFEPLEIKEKYGTRVVQIYFNAYNEELEFAKDLDFNKIELKVDGQPQKATEIKKVDEPITYCFLVDVSYSMKPAFNDNISALKKFIESMRPQDKGYFVTFSNKYQQILTPTASKAVLIAAADNLTLDAANPKFADRLYSENETYLYDAVIAAVHSQIQYPGRSVLLALSDGVGVEGIYRRNGMLSFARENEAVIYSLWLDNNPQLNEDELKLLQKEIGSGEKFARKIGLARFFADKDSRKVAIGNKVRNDSITQGILRILAEESGGFHYTINRDDRSLIKGYVEDITAAVGSTYVATVTLPISRKEYEVEVKSTDPKLAIRNKSKVKLSKTNPLLD